MSSRRSPSASPIRNPVSCNSTTTNRSRGRRHQASTAVDCSAVRASGKGVSALDLIDLARTMRNWPDSPTSKPGGVNLSQRGSDSRSATTISISPVLAQNRNSSHTAVRTAFTVEPVR